MMRMLIWLLIGYIVYVVIKRMAGGKEEIPSPKSKAEEAHRDPFCGTYVTEEDAVVGRLEGERLFFCSMSCLEKYQEKLTHGE